MAFSCKTRDFCPSCHQRRVKQVAHWIAHDLCFNVPHRQFVFTTMPKPLRGIFRKRRKLLTLLFHVAIASLREWFRTRLDLPNGDFAAIAGTIWRDENIDFASIHIYPSVKEALALSETVPVQPPYKGSLQISNWKHLQVYKAFADQIGKPLMLDEWGLDLDCREPEKLPNGQPGARAYSSQFALDYFRMAFARLKETGVPVSIVWNWHPGPHYSL